MTITIFVQPESLQYFIEVTKFLSKLDLENDYAFNPSDLIFSELMISNYVWISMDIDEYLKLRYCMIKISKNKFYGNKIH